MNIDKVFEILGKEVHKWDVPLIDLIKVTTDDPYKILVGTILSARTSDVTNAKACKRLFEKAPDFDALEKLSVKEIEELIYPVGFYITKARHLKVLPKIIREEFNGKIPDTIDELVKIPGVGRKTANLVVAVAFNKPAICVDTHVHKIVNRLGWIKTKNPYQTEMKLRELLPQKYWLTTNRIFVAFGQHLCRPLSPHCSLCPISEYCKRVGVGKTR